VHTDSTYVFSKTLFYFDHLRIVVTHTFYMLCHFCGFFLTFVASPRFVLLYCLVRVFLVYILPSFEDRSFSFSRVALRLLAWFYRIVFRLHAFCHTCFLQRLLVSFSTNVFVSYSYFISRALFVFTRAIRIERDSRPHAFYNFFLFARSRVTARIAHVFDCKTFTCFLISALNNDL